ncbi:hypothetical protein HNP40_001261 [Mycobacteroides chelonae]|nr:hypothetical protein [Mycobacteroides chelonae]
MTGLSVRALHHYNEIGLVVPSARKSGIRLSVDEQIEIFGDSRYGDACATEAHQRWGDTEAWKPIQESVTRYSKEDWARIGASQRAGPGAPTIAFAPTTTPPSPIWRSGCTTPWPPMRQTQHQTQQ